MADVTFFYSAEYGRFERQGAWNIWSREYIRDHPSAILLARVAHTVTLNGASVLRRTRTIEPNTPLRQIAWSHAQSAGTSEDSWCWAELDRDGRFTGRTWAPETPASAIAR